MVSRSDRHDPAEYLPLAQAAALIPPRRAGRKANVSTLYRWTASGCRGVRLRYIQIGGTRCTTREWLGEFFAELTRRSSGEAPAPVEPSASRRRILQAAERELDRLGV